MNIFLPIKLESINQYYRHFQGRVTISDRGRQQKQIIHKYIEDNKLPKLEGPVQIYVVCCYKDFKVRDIDNVLKPLIDCLKDKCFGDDKFVCRITIEKMYNPEVESVFINIQKL